MQTKVLEDDTVLTTHEAAELLQVNMSTIVSWATHRGLKAHRTPGGHRRIVARDLVDFLQAYDMPVCLALAGVCDV